MAAQLNTHPCPGSCGREVRDRYFACPACWRRLPRDLQGAILATAGKTLFDDDRHAALMDAIDWYQENAARAGGGR